MAGSGTPLCIDDATNDRIDRLNRSLDGIESEIGDVYEDLRQTAQDAKHQIESTTLLDLESAIIAARFNNGPNGHVIVSDVGDYYSLDFQLPQRILVNGVTLACVYVKLKLSDPDMRGRVLFCVKESGGSDWIQFSPLDDGRIIDGGSWTACGLLHITTSATNISAIKIVVKPEAARTSEDPLTIWYSNLQIDEIPNIFNMNITQHSDATVEYLPSWLKYSHPKLPSADVVHDLFTYEGEAYNSDWPADIGINTTDFDIDMLTIQRFGPQVNLNVKVIVKSSSVSSDYVTICNVANLLYKTSSPNSDQIDRACPKATNQIGGSTNQSSARVDPIVFLDTEGVLKVGAPDVGIGKYIYFTLTYFNKLYSWHRLLTDSVHLGDPDE